MPGWLFAGARPTFTLKASGQNGVSGGAAHLTVPGNVQAGDVIFFANYATSGAAIPGPVAFPGFVPVVDTSILASGSSGRSQRLTGQYKLADGSEAGATYYGMYGSRSSGLIMFVFTSETGLFGTLTPQDVAQQTLRDTQPATQTISCAGQILPLVAFSMDCIGQNDAALSMSPADAILKIAGAGFGAGYKIFNSNPSNVTVSCPNPGYNSLASFFLTGDV